MGRYLELLKKPTPPRTDLAEHIPSRHPGEGSDSPHRPTQQTLGWGTTITTETTNAPSTPPALAVPDHGATSFTQTQGTLCPAERDPDPEVAWRAEAMRHQVPARGPIPFLIAREASFVPGT